MNLPGIGVSYKSGLKSLSFGSGLRIKSLVQLDFALSFRLF